MEFLLAYDQKLFYLVNRLPHTPLFHTIALFLSGVGLGALLWVGIGLILFLREEKKDHRFFIPIGLALGMSWMIVELLLKNIVMRARPFVNAIDGVIVVGGEASGYSFPSSHATTAFAMAVVLSYFEPRLKEVFFVLAAFVSLSRVYMGVHFPVDIAVGAIIGVCIGIGSVRVALQVSRLKRVSSQKKKSR